LPKNWLLNLSMSPYIFVDLDDTLIHTFEDWEDPTADAIEIEVSGQTLKTSLRPGALDLLAQFRAVGNVNMLTIACADYAAKMNQQFGFGFSGQEIYPREKIKNKMIDLPPRDQVVLLDNLPRRENRNKIEFLRKVSTKGKVSYLQCIEYHGHPDFGFNQENIQFFLKKITHGNE
jgi:hypothetical protein